MSNSEPLLSVERLDAAWDGVPVLRGVSFDLGARELLALLGPNGSGKTTLLRCLLGLEAPTAGTVRLAGRPVDGVPVHRRGIGWMPQDAALFPRRTVLENIAYAPLLQGRSDAEAREEVARLVTLLRLEGFEDRAPHQLSGGERQRVALARTLAARPRVVLLDEPFAAIDLELRTELRTDFRRVLRELGMAAVHVTHDREEGMFLGDRVGLLVDGVLEIVGRPDDVYRHPPSERSARLLGYNVWAEGPGRIAVHPSDLRVVAASTGRRNATVTDSGSAGPDRLTVLALDDGTRVDVRERAEVPPRPHGSVAGLDWDRAVELPPRARPKEPKSAGPVGSP